MSTSATLTKQWDSLTVGDYTVLNNDWGIPASQQSSAYTSITVADTSNVNNNLTMNWTTPNVIPSTYVYAYPEVYWGGQYGQQLPNFSTTISNLKTLNVNYSVSTTSADSDVLLEVWTKNAAGTITHEIGVFVYGWGNGESVAYKDQYINALTNANASGAGGGGGAWNFVTYRTITDQLSGTISFSNILQDLVSKGIVDPNDYVSGLELGSEMRKGSGSLQVNNFNVYEAVNQTHTIVETATSANQIFDITTNNPYTINGGSGNIIRFEFPASNYTISTTAAGLSVVDKTSGSVITLNGISSNQLQFSNIPFFSGSSPNPPTPGAPTVTEVLSSDTGSSATDKITSTAALTGTADANSTIHFTVDGAVISATTTADSAGKWSYSPMGLADGSHTIIASETNSSGATGTASLAFTLDMAAPAVTASILNNTGSSAAPTLTTAPTLTGTGDAGATVTFKEGNTVLGTTTANAQGAWTYATTGLVNGAHTIVATETDLAGNTGSASVAFSLNIQGGGTSNNNQGQGSVSYTVGNNWGSGFIGNMAITGGTGGLNGWSVAFDSSFNITNIWGANITSHVGTHYVLQNVSYDAAVAAGTSVNIGFQATPGVSGTSLSGLSLNGGGVSPALPPTVTEVLSSDTGSSATDKITSTAALTGTADANSTIHFTVDGAVISATTTADSAGKWSYSPMGLADGSHTIIASETNSSGATGTASLAFTLDMAAPAVTASILNNTGSSAAPTLTTAPTLTGTGDAGATVTFKEGNTVLGTTTANAQGAWTYATTGLVNGAHTIVATETDLAGNTGSASVAFSLNIQGGGTSNNNQGQGSVSYTVGNNWGSGFIGNMAITGGTGGLNGWSVAFDSSFNITNIWGANITSHVGTHYVLQNVSYDAAVAAGTSVNIGFQATPGVSGTSLSGLSLNGGGAQTNVVGAGSTLSITSIGGVDTLQVATGGVANANVTSSWAPTSTTINNGSANISTNGIAVNLAATAAGTNGFNLTNTGTGASLTGSSGNDTIVGGAGNDIINGGLGADVLSGGGGLNTFVYTDYGNSLYSAHDYINDFKLSDKIQIGRTVDANSFNTLTNTASGNLLSDLTATLNNTNLSAFGADLVNLIGNKADAGSYLVVADGHAGFNANTDAVIQIPTGIAATAANFTR